MKPSYSSRLRVVDSNPARNHSFDSWFSSARSNIHWPIGPQVLRLFSDQIWFVQLVSESLKSFKYKGVVQVVVRRAHTKLHFAIEHEENPFSTLMTLEP